jgi:hypothetical protein
MWSGWRADNPTINKSLPSGVNRKDESRIPSSKSPRPPSDAKKVARWTRVAFRDSP